MTHFFADAKDFLSERFGSPFWLSTIVSWFIWNWKVSITALFQAQNFTVQYLENYFSATPFWYHLALPVLSGFLYAILSGSFRETLEIGAKILHDKISSIDKNGKLYNTISTDLHNKKIKILERQIERVSQRIAETEEISARNDALQTELENTRKRETELIDLIRAYAIEKNLDDSVKKLRFLNALHEKGFALAISEEEIDETKSSDSLPNVKSSEDVNEVNPIDPAVLPPSTSELEKKLSNLSELQDPNSVKTIFVTLLLAKSRNQILQDIPTSALGLSESVFTECANTLSTSNLMMIKGGKTLITSQGNERLNKLRKELKNSDVVSILDSMHENVKNEILNLLSHKSFSPKELYKNVTFHPDLPVLINELKDSNLIHMDGKLLFIGPESS